MCHGSVYMRYQCTASLWKFTHQSVAIFTRYLRVVPNVLLPTALVMSTSRCYQCAVVVFLCGTSVPFWYLHVVEALQYDMLVPRWYIDTTAAHCYHVRRSLWYTSTSKVPINITGKHRYHNFTSQVPLWYFGNIAMHLSLEWYTMAQRCDCSVLNTAVTDVPNGDPTAAQGYNCSTT